VNELDFRTLIPASWEDAGLLVRLGRGIRLSGDGAFFVAEIMRRRLSRATGRDLEPEKVISICGQPGESLPALLRQLADLFEHEGPIQLERDGAR
jgi:hypothetical protein